MTGTYGAVGTTGRCRALTNERTIHNALVPVPDRKFLRRSVSADRYFACAEIASVAEQKHRACVAHLKALRDRLEVGRSIGALVRLEWSGA